MLKLEAVTVRYTPDADPAVSRLDLEVVAGERVALVGPSGAGKSTIIGLANGLVLPTEGDVSISGIDSRELGARANRSVRSRIATIHQDFALVPSLRVAHNVAAGRLGSWSAARALRSLVRPIDVAGISAVLDRVGIAEKIWERAGNLSGGQQQRVAIARALYQQPDLFLADEPVSSLDPARSVAVLETLAEAMAGQSRAALVASIHDAALARSHFDRIVALRNGATLFDRPAAQVSADELDELYVLDDRSP